MSTPKRLLLVAFSAGWLLPIAVSGGMLISALGPEAIATPFPALETSQMAFWIGCTWLAIVIAYWTWNVTSAE